MARVRAPFRHALEYAAARGLSSLMQCFHIDQNLHTAAAMGSLYFRVNRGRRA